MLLSLKFAGSLLVSVHSNQRVAILSCYQPHFYQVPQIHLDLHTKPYKLPILSEAPIKDIFNITILDNGF